MSRRSRIFRRRRSEAVDLRSFLCGGKLAFFVGSFCRARPRCSAPRPDRQVVTAVSKLRPFIRALEVAIVSMTAKVRDAMAAVGEAIVPLPA